MFDDGIGGSKVKENSLGVSSEMASDHLIIREYSVNQFVNWQTQFFDTPFPPNLKLDFEIEVCKLSTQAIDKARQKELYQSGQNTPEKPPMCAVRRRRIKGDTWLYKNICNSILSGTDQARN